MKANVPNEGQLAAWATACSLGTASKGLSLKFSKIKVLSPTISSKRHIALTQGKSLVFSNQNLLKLAGGELALPLFRSFCQNPFDGIRTISTMQRVKALYLESKPTPDQVEILLQAALSASVCYLNFHTLAIDLLAGEIGAICFRLGPRHLGSVCKMKNGDPWILERDDSKIQPSVLLSFSDLRSAFRGAMGLTDPYVDPAEKNLSIKGRIPLLEKFGYVSRIVSREVPNPRNNLDEQ